MYKRLAIVLIVTLCPVAGWTAGAWHASRSHGQRAVDVPAADPVPQHSSASGWSALPIPLIEEPATEAQRDFYGNDVSPAVARYTHDAAGAVLEEHSPTTEVARLKPPTT